MPANEIAKPVPAGVQSVLVKYVFGLGSAQGNQHGHVTPQLLLSQVGAFLSLEMGGVSSSCKGSALTTASADDTVGTKLSVYPASRESSNDMWRASRQRGEQEPLNSSLIASNSADSGAVGRNGTSIPTEVLPTEAIDNRTLDPDILLLLRICSDGGQDTKQFSDLAASVARSEEYSIDEAILDALEAVSGLDKVDDVDAMLSVIFQAIRKGDSHVREIASAPWFIPMLLRLGREHYDLRTKIHSHLSKIMNLGIIEPIALAPITRDNNEAFAHRRQEEREHYLLQMTKNRQETMKDRRNRARRRRRQRWGPRRRWRARQHLIQDMNSSVSSALETLAVGRVCDGLVSQGDLMKMAKCTVLSDNTEGNVAVEPAGSCAAKSALSYPRAGSPNSIDRGGLDVNGSTGATASITCGPGSLGDVGSIELMHDSCTSASDLTMQIPTTGSRSNSDAVWISTGSAGSPDCGLMALSGASMSVPAGAIVPAAESTDGESAFPIRRDSLHNHVCRYLFAQVQPYLAKYKFPFGELMSLCSTEANSIIDRQSSCLNCKAAAQNFAAEAVAEVGYEQAQADLMSLCPEEVFARALLEKRSWKDGFALALKVRVLERLVLTQLLLSLLPYFNNTWFFPFMHFYRRFVRWQESSKTYRNM